MRKLLLLLFTTTLFLIDTINVKAQVTATGIDSINVSCNGAGNGWASVSVSGGTIPYTYSWSNGLTTQVNGGSAGTGIGAGNYTITVTDNTGASSSAVVTITEPTILSGNTSSTNATCPLDNGSASVSVGGGTAPYTYSWTSGGTNATSTGLGAGTYQVTVTDANGCQFIGSATVASSSPITLGFNSIVNVACNGNCTGSAKVIASNGTAPYTYAWSTAPTQTNQTATGLCAGTYTVTVTDNDGCTTPGIVHITQPNAITVNINTYTYPLCNGEKTGTAKASPLGGTAPYTYSWAVTSPTQTTQTATGLGAGNYTVTVTDKNGCSETALATITQPTIVTGTFTTVPVVCNGGSTGSATVTGHGGTAPYVSYSWTTLPTQTTQTATGLSAGTYTVTITDNNGCTGTSSVIITQTAALLVSPVPHNPNCNGELGSATASDAGGTTPYTYSWTTLPIQTTQTATGLTIGSYTVTVTDNNGCTNSAEVTITQPTVLTVNASATTAPLCNGGSGGGASSTTTGGTTPYTYSWSPSGGNGANATGLTAGTFTLTVTDNNGCTSSTTVIITQPPLLTVSITPTDPICIGGKGSATANPSGGVSPYTYSWSTAPVQHTQTATGLVIGSYTVTVTDNNGCTATSSVTITQPATLTVSITPNDPPCFGELGSATANPSGGTAAYTYSWATSPIQTTQTSTGLTVGTYTVNITDACGDVASSTVVITQPATAVSASANTTGNVSCHGEGSASASGSGGVSPYTYSWSPSGGTSSTATGLAAGTYTVTVTDNHGCTATATTVITQPANSLNASAGVTADVSCFGDKNGSASASASGGNSPYTYSWSTVPVQNTTNATGLGAGTYTITVTDAIGCTSSASVIITQPTLLSISGDAHNPSCNGDLGSATTSTTGGTTPYTYSWTTSPTQTTSNATGLTIGSYTITVTDNNGCTATASITITQPNVLSATIAANQPLCNGDLGTATANATGGTVPYTYSWTTSPTQTAQTSTGLTIGTYTVTVTDNHGCTTTASIVITQPNVLNTTISATQPPCNGNLGSATANTTGGTIPYTYSWTTSPIQTSANATGLTIGTYTVTVRDNNGCSTTASVIITQPALLSITSTASNPLCNGDLGSSTTTTTGGTTPYTYSWTTSPTQTTSNATGLTIGTYTVTVTDNNGCIATAATIITQPNVLGTTIAANQPLCNGDLGTATANATGGTVPYTYSWTTSPTQTTQTSTGLTIGTYTVTVTDNNGCSTSASIVITQPNILGTTISATEPLCNGNLGTATANTTGGTIPYTYSWTTSPIQTTQTSTGLTIGTYTVTVRDNNGCSTTASVVITQPTLLTVTANTTVNVSCHSEGSTSSTTTGGTLPYTYSWSSSPIQNTTTATDLGAGTYTITVTDANGCTSSASTVVTQPLNALDASVQITANVSCFGGDNGSAISTTTGGTVPYTYSWSTAPTQTTQTATGLTAGTYTLNVTDAGTCTSSYIIVITQPTLLTATTNATTNVSCNGGNNGSASSTVTGGTTPYTYAWSDGSSQSTTNATGLTAGTYTINVTDANGCNSSASVIITQPNILTATANTTANVTCNGLSNGSASSTITGGTTPYTYSWTGGAGTNANATGLTAGTYTVDVTDANGCTSSASVIVTQPAILNTTANTTANVTCNGLSDGSASSTTTGGTTPYTYAWSDGGSQSTANATGLTAGTYTINVTDANGCTSSATVIITQPLNALNASANVTTNVSCNGGNNGSASSSVSGGTTPYTYAWSDGGSQTTANATGLTAGTYTIDVTDANGCTSSAFVIITQPNILTATANTTTNVSCFAGNNGSASSTVTGGTTPYTYAWTGGAGNNANATGLTAGTYTVDVTDANGCTGSAFVIITQPANSLSVTANVTTNVSCFGNNDGSASSSVSGGTSPYTYLWTGGAGTNANATGLTAGTYTVGVTDANGCTNSATIVITQPNLLTVTANASANVTCNGLSNGTASSTVTGGTTPYTYAWSDGGSQTTANATGLTAGTYTVDVTDANGCISTTSVIITQPAVLVTDITFIYSECTALMGVATANSSGGTTPYTYLWSDASVQTTNPATGLTVGTYSVLVTDNNGCTATASVTITQPLTLGVTATATDPLCNGQLGSATATASGGYSPYTYLWTGGAGTNSNATGLNVGTYTITVTDNTGCTTSTSVTITQPTVVSGTFSTVDEVCNAGNTGTATVTGTGGTAPYLTYLWTPTSQTTQTATGLSAGTYTVTITDNNGCAGTASVTITQPTPVSGTFSTTGVICNGGNTGTATVTGTGGTAPYVSYSWTPTSQTTQTATGLSAGTYTVTITDNNGCTGTASVTITQSTPLGITYNNTGVSCNGGDNGTSAANVSGGLMPYTYSWSTTATQTTQTATGLSAGTYSITVTDANGCTETSETTITQPNALALTVTFKSDTCAGNDGVGIATVSGGAGPYTYSWAPSGQTSLVATGLNAGVYTITVTDANGCNITETDTVKNTTHISATISIIHNILCNGDNYGEVTANATGGSLPYTYLWSTVPAQTTQTATGLTAGTYTVNVTTHAGCSYFAVVVLTQPTAIVPVTSSTPSGCTNITGTATVGASGGTPGYTYIWSNGETTSTITGLGSGLYTVTVTDANGCSVTTTCNVYTNGGVTGFITTLSNVACFGDNTGSALITITNGANPYTYTWSTLPAQTTANVTGLSAGTYTVSVRDANGCLYTESTIIQGPTTALAVGQAGTNATCNSSDNGTITLSVSGGTAPYTYTWSPNIGASGSFTNILPGAYSYTVTDNNGCAEDGSITINATMSVIAAQGTNTLVCTTNSIIELNGESSVNATAFQWYQMPGMVKLGNGDTNVFVHPPLGSTTYELIVSNGACTDTSHNVITVAPAPVNAGPNQIIYGTGSVTLGGTPTAPPPDSAYYWSPGLGTLNDSTIQNPIASPTVTTIYTVTVIDSAGCRATDTVTIFVYAGLNVTSGFSPNGDGINDTWVLPWSSEFPNIQVEVYNRWGELLFHSDGYSIPWDGTYDGKPLPIGTYYYVIVLNDPKYPKALTGPLTILR